MREARRPRVAPACATLVAVVMIRGKLMRHVPRAGLALACIVLVVVAGCGGAGGGGQAAGGDVGPPQRGGSAVMLQASEQRSLDPALMNNAYALHSMVGNALYGVLLTTDVVSGEISYGLAEDLSSSDGGASWALRLREGLRFSDGSALDAAAVKVNWDRMKDPALGSTSLGVASLLETTTVVDVRTLTFTLRTAMAGLPDSVAASSLNWIASPAALQAGQRAFDANPVGAGPFVFKSWTRQDKLELVRNPSYFDPQRPYLDALTVRTVIDENQRLSTLTSGGADLIVGTSAETGERGEQAGFVATHNRVNGGVGLLFNHAVAPFDDPRAREAVSKAIDLDAVNAAAFGGKEDVATTLFRRESPLFADIPLASYDKPGAQALFDELAAEGKPVNFTITSAQATASRKKSEAIQAQLSQYAGVTVHVEVVESGVYSTKLAQGQFQAINGSPGALGDPGFALWSTLHSQGSANNMGVRDAELDAALDAGRSTTDVNARRGAYQTVQRRLAQLHPFLLATRESAVIVADEEIHGVELYGIGSLLVDRVWTEEATP